MLIAHQQINPTTDHDTIKLEKSFIKPLGFLAK